MVALGPGQTDKAPALAEHGASSHGIIVQNFVGILVVDSIGVGMAALGFLNPLVAAFIHVASELAFISNFARLLPGSSETT